MRIPPMPPRDDRPAGEQGFVSLRDTFAAAALPLATRNNRTCEDIAKACYGLADAMLRERSRSGKNGSETVPEATKCTERESVTEPLPKEKRAEVSDRSYEKTDEKRVLSDMKSEPLAWAVIFGREHEIVYEVTTRREVANEYLQDVIAGRVVPLYRSPTLTADEREAVEDSEQFWAEGSKQAATLRSLLERLA